MKTSRTKSKTARKSTGTTVKKAKASATNGRNGSAHAPKSLAALNRWMKKNEDLLIRVTEANCVKLTGKKRF